jgi:aminopeptidase N
MNLYFRKLYLILFLVSALTYGQTQKIDVLHYTNSITVTDSSDVIIGISDIDILFKTTVSNFSLDLINLNEDEKGMVVSKVLENNKPVEFSHIEDKLNINTSASTNEKHNYTIHYSGIPADGLIISKNKYGDRTFFGDNWPNRARNWVPCVDHPLDKAFVTFKITAPSHYQVIANGMQVEETDLNNVNTFYVWKTNVAIPTKVMVIGIAKFAVEYIGEVQNIPVSSWVYPQNKEAGFYDYAQAKTVLEFFIENVGPYPYQKLANVQSKTRFGGMENASNIFYFENSVTGKREQENLIAHEIAHQWFGNSASEIDWSHLWLSEGFATYFTNLYVEQIHGKEALYKRLQSERKTVIDFAKNQYTPVVDFDTKDYMKLLNANSYQKGGWILHMLRKKIGDDLFWEGIRKYYDTYKLNNASTDDLRLIFETVSKQDLKAFFKQWLFTSGHPELTIQNQIEDNKLNITIAQKQQSEHTFTFPLELKLIYDNGSEELKTLEVSKQNEAFSISLRSELKDIVIDPDTWLLFENITASVGADSKIRFIILGTYILL